MPELANLKLSSLKSELNCGAVTPILIVLSVALLGSAVLVRVLAVRGGRSRIVSFNARRMCATATHLVDHVFPSVGRRTHLGARGSAVFDGAVPTNKTNSLCVTSSRSSGKLLLGAGARLP